MQPSEAADLIRAVRDSLAANPNQFHVEISMSGFTAQNTGGVGFQASNTGGTGFSSTVGGGQIQITQQQAGGAMNQAIGELLERLTAIEAELREPTPDKGKIHERAKGISASTWVPAVIPVILAALIKAAGF